VLTIVLGLTAAAGWGLHDFLIQPVARKAGPYTALFWVVLASAAILMGAALAIDGVPSGGAEWRAVAIAAGGGVTYVISVAALLRGLAVGDLSLVTPLVALGGGVGAVVAIVLGETVDLLAAIAIPLAVVGAVLASLVRGPVGEAAGPAADEGRGGEPPRGRPGAARPLTAQPAVDDGDGPVSAEPAGPAAEAAMADPAAGVHPADLAAEVASPRRVQAAAGAGWALLGALLFGTTFVIYGYADEVSSVTAAA
jgi:drug/metabolite transporter (DMT)-like permease